MLSRLSKNTFNFIRWQRASSGTVADLPVSTLDSISLSAEYELTNNYRNYRPSARPALLKNNNHLIHINLDERISDDPITNWRVDLYDMAGNTADTALGTLTKCSINGADFRLYFTCNIDASVANGLYQMVIQNTLTGNLIYVSSCIEVISTAEIPEYTYLEYRNSSNIYAFDYEGIAGYNSVFIRMNIIDQQPEGEIKQYIERSTGRPRNQKSQGSKIIIGETMFFGDGDHDAMNGLSFHDDIKINGRAVTVKEIYKVETNPRNNRAKGTIEFNDLRYSSVNLSK